MIFIDFIKNTISNRCVWDYYSAYFFKADPEIVAVLKYSPKSFITDYFKNGSKNLALSVGDKNDDMSLFPDFRATHTVSAFFIGLLIEKSMPDEQLSILGDDGAWEMPFSYLWFLTCLYHDYGYCANSEEPPIFRPDVSSLLNGHRGYFCPGINWGRLCNVKKKYDVRFSIYSRYSIPELRRDTPLTEDNILRDLTGIRKNVVFNNGTIVSGFRYPSHLVANYFNYYFEKVGHSSNHGIIGGYIFYDRMIKSYMKAYKDTDTRDSNPHQDYKDFYFQDKGNGSYKRFFSEQIPVFKYIADCIIAHDIWIASEEKRETYLNYGLEDLLPDSRRFQKVKYRENPILFILALADAIEPCKLFRDDCDKDELWRIWEKYEIAYSKRHSAFTIALHDTKFNKLYANVKSLEDWVDVKVDKGRGRSVIIKMCE